MNIKQPLFDSIRIVLVEPQVPGNVGSTARAMKNMGLTQLRLVNPWFNNHSQSRYMAHGSEDILDNALLVDDLESGIADSVLVVGATRRMRRNTPFLSPKQAAEEMLVSAQKGPVSLLFGREDKGLTNEELKCCQMLVTIPSSESQPSLNLSQAVMIMAYELFTTVCPVEAAEMDYAESRELVGMYDHLLESLTTLGLRQWNDGDNFMKALRRVFSRTRLEKRDVGTIHKLCGEIDKYASRVRAQTRKDQKI